METINILYEISKSAVIKYFIEEGVYYNEDCEGRWFSVLVNLSDISSEDRRLIWETCKDQGDGTFVYNIDYTGRICHSANEFIEELRDNHPEIVINTLDKFADYINSKEDWDIESSEIIEKNGWTDETGETSVVCSDDKRRIVLDDNGQAVVIEK